MTDEDRALTLRWANGHRYVHRRSLMRAAGIPDDGSTRAEREFRKLAAWLVDSLPCEFWPVVERPGWWTTSPTEEIRAWAEYFFAVQDATKYARHALRLQRFRFGTGLHRVVDMHSALIQAYLAQLRQQLPKPDRDDSCLKAIDGLIAQGAWEG